MSKVSLNLLFLSTATIVAALSKDKSGNDDQGGDQSTEGSSDIMTAAHGTTAVLAWVIFFPLGATLIRVINSSKAWWIHASIQTLAIFLMIAATASGISIAEKEQLCEYHPLIGLVLLSIIGFQAICGLVHHLLFRKHGRRTFISHLHIWVGRVLITVGMINGGLGLLFSEEEVGKCIAYGIVAGVIWLAYIVTVLRASPSFRSKSSLKHEGKGPRTYTTSSHVQLVGIDDESRYH